MSMFNVKFGSSMGHRGDEVIKSITNETMMIKVQKKI